MQNTHNEAQLKSMKPVGQSKSLQTSKQKNKSTTKQTTTATKANEASNQLPPNHKVNVKQNQ